MLGRAFWKRWVFLIHGFFSSMGVCPGRLAGSGRGLLLRRSDWDRAKDPVVSRVLYIRGYVVAAAFFLISCFFFRPSPTHPTRPPFFLFLPPPFLSAQLVLRTQDVKESVRKAAFRTLGEDVSEKKFFLYVLFKECTCAVATNFMLRCLCTTLLLCTVCFTTLLILLRSMYVLRHY